MISRQSNVSPHSKRVRIFLAESSFPKSRHRIGRPSISFSSGRTPICGITTRLPEDRFGMANIIGLSSGDPDISARVGLEVSREPEYLAHWPEAVACRLSAGA